MTTPVELLPCCLMETGVIIIFVLKPASLEERLQLEFHDHFDQLLHLHTGNCFELRIPDSSETL